MQVKTINALLCIAGFDAHIIAVVRLPRIVFRATLDSYLTPFPGITLLMHYGIAPYFVIRFVQKYVRRSVFSEVWKFSITAQRRINLHIYFMW